MMDPTLIALTTTAVGEALKTWGSYALVLIVLGVMHWRSAKREISKDEEIKLLREENRLLQEKRLEDAQKLIRVTEVGTATMASRSQGDQDIAGALKQLADSVGDLKDLVSPKPTRRPSR